MKKQKVPKRHRKTAITFYILGTIAALYVGVFLLIVKPVYDLYIGITTGLLSFHYIFPILIKILLSGTVGGFVWCIGYVMFNHFMGTEDPDWDALNPKEEPDETETCKIE